MIVSIIGLLPDRFRKVRFDFVVTTDLTAADMAVLVPLLAGGTVGMALAFRIAAVVPAALRMDIPGVHPFAPVSVKNAHSLFATDRTVDVMIVFVTLLIPRYFVLAHCRGSTVLAYTSVDIGIRRPLPVVGRGLRFAAVRTGFGVGIVVVRPFEAVRLRLCLVADLAGPGVRLIAIVLPVEAVRTAFLRAADCAGTDVAAVFVAPIAVGMGHGFLYPTALAGKLMLPVPQVLDFREVVGGR